MKNSRRWFAVLAVSAGLLGVGGAMAADWPQWRGLNRDGKATGFKAPATWPKELTQKWKTAVGDGVATPALVGNRLYRGRIDSDAIRRLVDSLSPPTP